MSMTDPLADMITRIRNAQAMGKRSVSVPCSKLKQAVAQVLKDEGYIRDFSVSQQSNNKADLEMELKYYEGKSVIGHIARFSRSGLRQYRSRDALPKILNGLGISIISTSQGVMTDAQARAKGLGGEVICTVA